MTTKPNSNQIKHGNGTVKDVLDDLTGPTGSVSVGYTPAGTGAVATTVQSKLRESVSVKDFGAVGDGVADDTAAIQAALNAGGHVRLSVGIYKITAQIVIPPNCTGIVGSGMYSSVIKKEFNGDAIKCDTSGVVFCDFEIDGNGATYTGGGIRPRGYNIKIQHCRINDTEDSPVIVEGAIGSSALSATYLIVDSCFLNPTNTSTTFAVRSVGSDDSTIPTGRVFSNLSGGSSLVDFSGMNYAVLRDSLGSRIKFDNNCSKIVITGNRFTNATSSITIYGQSHCIDSNLWGFGAGYSLILDETAATVYFGPLNLISINGSIHDSIALEVSVGGANINNVFTQLKTGTFGWYAATTNPTIGNGAAQTYYALSGRLCYATIAMQTGSTTNVGNGLYTFQLPFKALVISVGTCRIQLPSGIRYVCTLVVQGGSSVATVSIDTLSADFSSSSLAFTAGSVLYASITYLVAAS